MPDPDEHDAESLDNAIIVDLTEDEESQNWLREESEERKFFTELTDEEAEERLEEAEDKLEALYIDRVFDYMQKNLPREYSKTRGPVGLINEASVAVGRVDVHDYFGVTGQEVAQEILSDAGYSLAKQS